MAALTAAIVASLAGKANSISTIYSLDIYKKYINRDATDTKIVTTGRVIIIISLIIAIIINWNDALGIGGNTSFAGTGIRRRGRPRKIKGGDLASVSKPFRRALKNNFNGLVLSNIVNNNQPVSRFSVNPKVKPSSTEMTLSPYQSMSSPAMNPFIPTSYRQQGGTSQGYGGRGLHHHDMGLSKMDVIHFGNPHDHLRRKRGVGLYGP
jgi:hypothetical protein